MFSWQEVIKEFAAEKAAYNGEAATLILMYLAVKREDYSYNMAKIFKKELSIKNHWNVDRLHYLRSLKNQAQLGVLLTKMEEKGFLASRKEQIGRSYKYYRLSEDILCSPFADKDFRKLHHALLEMKETHMDECKAKEIARNFLDEPGDNDVHNYFIIWSEVQKFDFLTFLGFINKIAIDTKNNEMLTLISRNIHHIKNGEKEGAKISLILNFSEKMELENKARAIYKEPSLYDRFDDG